MENTENTNIAQETDIDEPKWVGITKGGSILDRIYNMYLDDQLEYGENFNGLHLEEMREKLKKLPGMENEVKLEDEDNIIVPLYEAALSIFYSIASPWEKTVFLDGVRIGARLMSELK